MMRPEIKVDPKHRGQGYSLDPMSRLNYGSLHGFAYGVKVKTIGRVSDMSSTSFEFQFRLVWKDRIPQAEDFHAAPTDESSTRRRRQIEYVLTKRFEQASTVQEVLTALHLLRQYAAQREYDDIPVIDQARARILATVPLSRQTWINNLRAAWAAASEEDDDDEEED